MSFCFVLCDSKSFLMGIGPNKIKTCTLTEKLWYCWNIADKIRKIWLKIKTISQQVRDSPHGQTELFLSGWVPSRRKCPRWAPRSMWYHLWLRRRTGWSASHPSSRKSPALEWESYHTETRTTKRDGTHEPFQIRIRNIARLIYLSKWQLLVFQKKKTFTLMFLTAQWFVAPGARDGGEREQK